MLLFLAEFVILNRIRDRTTLHGKLLHLHTVVLVLTIQCGFKKTVSRFLIISCTEVHHLYHPVISAMPHPAGCYFA